MLMAGTARGVYAVGPPLSVPSPTLISAPDGEALCWPWARKMPRSHLTLTKDWSQVIALSQTPNPGT